MSYKKHFSFFPDISMRSNFAYISKSSFQGNFPPKHPSPVFDEFSMWCTNSWRMKLWSFDRGLNFLQKSCISIAIRFLVRILCVFTNSPNFTSHWAPPCGAFFFMTHPVHPSPQHPLFHTDRKLSSVCSLSVYTSLLCVKDTCVAWVNDPSYLSVSYDYNVFVSIHFSWVSHFMDTNTKPTQWTDSKKQITSPTSWRSYLCHHSEYLDNKKSKRSCDAHLTILCTFLFS